MSTNEIEKEQTDAYGATMQALRQVQDALPDFTSSYDGEINRLYEQINNRKEFRYDVNSDPLYNMYRDRYVSDGRMAMRDTMGQAASLTGGYGSSYGQAVGQQQYDAYLQKLSALMPELYTAAYDRYAAEGDRLAGQLDTAAKLADKEYGRAKDKQNAAISLEKESYNRRWQSYQSLIDIIFKSGYQPSSEELEAAGMSQEQAEALRYEYLRANKLLPTGGGSSGGGGAYWGGSSSAKKSGKEDTTTSKEKMLLAGNARGASKTSKTSKTRRSGFTDRVQ